VLGRGVEPRVGLCSRGWARSRVEAWILCGNAREANRMNAAIETACALWRVFILAGCANQSCRSEAPSPVRIPRSLRILSFTRRQCAADLPCEYGPLPNRRPRRVLLTRGLCLSVENHASVRNELVQVVKVLHVAGEHAGPEQPRLKLEQGVVEQPSFVSCSSGRRAKTNQLARKQQF
jgi:hypothetical protein